MPNVCCPLCESPSVEVYLDEIDKTFGKRVYYRCSVCDLIFLDQQFHLSQDAEKERYDTHNNSPSDEGYVNFLNRLLRPLSEKMGEGKCGIDFGCGPGPAVKELMEQKGHRVTNYDPFYCPNYPTADVKFDFVTCTEVIEHLREPRQIFEQMNDLLQEGGNIGFMTFLHDGIDFEGWWYRKDPTHITFYSSKTFAWISRWLGWQTEVQDERVILCSKPA